MQLLKRVFHFLLDGLLRSAPGASRKGKVSTQLFTNDLYQH